MTLHDTSMENVTGNLMMVFSEDHKVRLQSSIVFVNLLYLITNKRHNILINLHTNNINQL